MTEKQYQRDKFLYYHRKEVPNKYLRIIFNNAWKSANRLRDILNLADHIVEGYKMGVNS